jgi:hypothetical protein
MSGNFKKIKFLSKNKESSKKAKEILDQIAKASLELQDQHYDEAKRIYLLVMPLFKELSKEIKKDVYPAIHELSGRLDSYHLHKLLDKAFFGLEHNQRTSAVKIYKQVSGIYKTLAPKYKAKVLERCNELHKKLQK